VTKHLAYVFYKNHISFFLSVFKKTNTLHLYRICGGIKTLKQGWAIIVAPGPLRQGHIQRRAVPSNGNRSKSWLR